MHDPVQWAGMTWGLVAGYGEWQLQQGYAINKRVGVLGRAVGIANLSPYDCRHYWATAAIRGVSDIKRVQKGGGWQSAHMPLQYASRGAIANEGIRLADT